MFGWREKYEGQQEELRYPASLDRFNQEEGWGPGQELKSHLAAPPHSDGQSSWAIIPTSTATVTKTFRVLLGCEEMGRL